MQENDAMSLTVFANFRIDTEERLQRMKDSFESFRDASVERWVINIRGHFRNDAMQFLSTRLEKKLYPSFLESGKGWFFDSRKMLDNIQSEYILFWIEDHICTCGAQRLNAVIKEMVALKIEYLGYSWFGMGKYLKEFDNLEIEKSANMLHLYYDKYQNSLRQKNSIRIINGRSYIISVCGVFSKELFLRIVMCKRPWIRRWPKETPFDFEKRWDDDYILPINYGVTKIELFSAIDDDNKHPGSSLISRGLYPERERRGEHDVPKRFQRLRKILKSIPYSLQLWKLLVRLRYHF